MSIISALIGSVQEGLPPTLSINYSTPNPASEGSPLDVFYNYNNFTGQTVYWSLDYSSGINYTNFEGATSGSFTLNGSNSDVLVLYPKNDYYTQGDWSVNVKFGSQPGLSDYTNTGSLTVQDISHGITATMTETHSAVDEGQTNTFTFTDLSSPSQLAGKTLYWKVANVTGANMGGNRFNGYGTGTFVMNNATHPVGTFDVTVSADHLTSPDQQYYKMSVYSTDPDNTNLHAVQLIQTGDITVIDTSQSVTAFDLVNPPQNVNLLPWVDSASGVSATVVGGWTAPSDHGGAVGLISAGYIEVSYVNTSPTFTLSFAADFEPTGGQWNTIFSGGDYNTSSILAYTTSAGIDIEVGTGVYRASASTSVTGLAWWDFVYDGTNVSVYKNGTLIIGSSLTATNTGIGSNLRVGLRYGSAGDYLTGSIYRIKYQQTALDSTGITTQYNSVKSTYGLS